MINIQLEPLPNQTLTFQQDGHFYAITIKACQDMMYASVTRDNVTISENSRLVAGGLMLPYAYQEDGGNLAIITDEGDAPWYEQFNNSQFLIYYSAADLEAARG